MPVNIAMNKATQDIGAECPNCQRAYTIRDLDKYLENRLALWRFILYHIKSGDKKQRLIGSLAICSAKETLIKEIEEEGGLIATCLSCMIKILEKIQLSNTVNKFECILK
jgi:hypothetical protein